MRYDLAMRSGLRVGIIGGSGLGDMLLQGMNSPIVESHSIDTPFGKTSGPILSVKFGDAPIALLQRHGDGHVLNPRAVPYRANIFALKVLGVTHIIASGAVGSLREHIHPGELVLCDQLIDRTEGRPRTFFEEAAVHVEFAEPFCPMMRRWLLGAAENLDDVNVHEAGCYVCMEGPSFSTRAESHLHRQWGGDVIGMTALPEARLAREAQIAYALIAMPTDYDSWRPHHQSHPVGDQSTLLAEIIGNLNRATEACLKLIRTALRDLTVLKRERSPAHEALKLALWSDRSKIDPTLLGLTKPLWA